MPCTTECRKPNGNQAHCGACHQTFAGVSAFDHHRVGHVDDRACADPAERGMRLNAYGVWSQGDGSRPAFWMPRAQPSGDPQTAEPASDGKTLGSGTPGASTAQCANCGHLVLPDGSCACSMPIPDGGIGASIVLLAPVPGCPGGDQCRHWVGA